MIQDAESTYPSECCGLLIGTDGTDRVASEARPCQNATSEMPSIRYKIPPSALLETERSLAGSDRIVLGIYHSHPDHSAQPSRFDFDHAWPWYTYLILATKRRQFQEIQAWRLSPNLSEFQKEELKVLRTA